MHKARAFRPARSLSKVARKGAAMPYVQIALPLALIIWLALWPLRGRARLIHVALTIASLCAIILLFPWLWPSAYAPVLLIILLILTVFLGRRRAPERHASSLWPGILAALATLTVTIGAAGLLTARLRPAATLDLGLPFSTAFTVTEGGAREVINRHRAVLDANSPSLSSWTGTAYGITLQPVDHWGKSLTEAQPVLAPCAGPVTLTGQDSRLGRFVTLTCAGNHIVLSGLTSVTAQGGVEAGAPLGTATTLTLHAQTPGTSAHPFSGDPLWLSLNGSFPVRGWVIRP
ncbi:MAG: hypothetical protein RLZZ437_550 [Pseudomonadota bacterium]